MWKERNDRGIKGDPPCDTCWVDPMPENEEAWRVFNINRYQLIIAGMDGVIVDVNHIPIYSLMKVLGVPDELKCLEKVLALNSWWVKKLNKKGD